MKRAIGLIGGLCILVGFEGCKHEAPDTEENVTREMAKVMTDLGESLASIQDPATAEAARPKIQAAAERWQQLKQRLAAAQANPPARPGSTQTLGIAQIELKAAQKFAWAQWVRVSKQEPWGYDFVAGFQNFMDAMGDEPAEPETRPATVPVSVP